MTAEPLQELCVIFQTIYISAVIFFLHYINHANTNFLYVDTGDDCGCSVSFLPMTWPSSPSYDSGEVNIRVVNFIWQSVKDR